jgi:CheY-like chemotaxis protein
MVRGSSRSPSRKSRRNGKEAQLAPGEYVRITSPDTGSGIAPEHLERRVRAVLHYQAGRQRHGLGLSQIFGFAAYRAVTCRSRSQPARDHGLALSAPLARPRGPVPCAPAPAAGAPAAAGTSILVVEDDPRVSRGHGRPLEELGYRTIACASGAEALAILDRERDIELLITDVMMPEMTGPELVRIVGSRFPDLAVLFVTGYVREQDEGEELTGYDLLRKPFTVSALADAVAAALSRASATSRHLSESRRDSTSEAAE